MPRFFTDQLSGEEVTLTGEDARHIARSLRMREGEALTVCDARGTDYDCEITSLCEHMVRAKVLRSGPSLSEPSVKVRLYQALPKGDKLEFIVQKAVELGAFEIVPVLTSRCISRPDGKSMQKKRVRLQRVALEAAKQSGRGIVPQVAELHSFEQAVARMKESDAAILLYERSTVPLARQLDGGPRDVSLLVGSEGGFSPEEVLCAQAAGLAALSLGKRILRCETAPVCALSILLYALGQME